ncbi:MAG TPA: dienelactone hydrolase family protein, partial [Rudaea sp.]|nr:dienelactone hydrolase family protein [Rudaea sp.]
KFVPEEQIVAFQKEMRDANVDWQFVSFGGAVHCFAIPSAKGDVPGCLYNERAAKRAYEMMHAFLADTFAGK